MLIFQEVYSQSSIELWLRHVVFTIHKRVLVLLLMKCLYFLTLGYWIIFLVSTNWPVLGWFTLTMKQDVSKFLKFQCLKEMTWVSIWCHFLQHISRIILLRPQYLCCEYNWIKRGKKALPHRIKQFANSLHGPSELLHPRLFLLYLLAILNI